MYDARGRVGLKSGEEVDFGVVTGPDAGWAERLGGLLRHKGPDWFWQVRQALADPAVGYESRFFVLSKAGRPIANICTFEVRGVGILGHVYTVPEERRKGAADVLMQRVMDDFRSRNGCALYLGTEFDTPPYHLYARHGFVGVEPGSGYMYYIPGGREAFEATYLAPGPYDVAVLAMAHWPVLPALTMCEHPARTRAVGLGVLGPGSLEGGALALMYAFAETGEVPAMMVAKGRATGAVLAFACCRRDPTFPNSASILDVFCAAGAESAAQAALAALPLPVGRKVIGYVDTAWPQKARILHAAGFVREATLKRHLALPVNGGRLDVELWSRPA